MRADTQRAPGSVRPLKPRLEDPDADCAAPTSKHPPRLPSLPSSPTPSIDKQNSPDLSQNLRRSTRPGSCTSSLKSTNIHRRRRALEDCDTGDWPASKVHPLQTQEYLSDWPVYDWLSRVPSVRSAPPRLGGNQGSLTVARRLRRSDSLPALGTMAKRGRRAEEGIGRGSSTPSGSTSKPGTSSSLYRSVLYNNDVIMDYQGKMLPQELQGFRDRTILKRRSSRQFRDDSVDQILDTVEDIAEGTEAPTLALMRTPMYPLKYGRGIGEGGNTQWSTDALPNNPQYPYSLIAPKPDLHLGYASGQKSQWTYAESAVIDHRVARPYTRPGRNNTFPFLMFEVKSEAAGGTLWHAENQAAGSGSYAVNALRWLFEQASLTPSLTDTVAFTANVTHREVIFYIHWYSLENGRFFMSYLTRYWSLDATDIRACNNTVKNIIDYALGPRKEKIKAALRALYPFPGHWRISRPTEDGSTNVTTSVTTTAESKKPRKRPRRS